MKQLGDEFRLRLDVFATDLPNLPLPDHCHRLIACRRSSGRPEVSPLQSSLTNAFCNEKIFRIQFSIHYVIAAKADFAAEPDGAPICCCRFGLGSTTARSGPASASYSSQCPIRSSNHRWHLDPHTFWTLSMTPSRPVTARLQREAILTPPTIVACIMTTVRQKASRIKGL